MSGENPYPSKNTELIWKELDAYFGNPAENSRFENIRWAGPLIDRWGRAFVVGGFSWVAESIEKEGVESSRLALQGMSDGLLNLRLFGLARRNFDRLRDAVSISGSDIGAFLVSNLGPAEDEDEAALSAYMLASEFIPTLDRLKLDVSRIYLKGLLSSAVGTSYRMTLAWALYNMGEKQEWESMVYGDVFVKRDFLDRLEGMMEDNEFDFGGRDVKSVLCEEYAVPGSTGFVPDFLIGNMGIFEILALELPVEGELLKIIQTGRGNRRSDSDFVPRGPTSMSLILGKLAHVLNRNGKIFGFSCFDALKHLPKFIRYFYSVDLGWFPFHQL